MKLVFIAAAAEIAYVEGVVLTEVSIIEKPPLARKTDNEEEGF